MSSFFQGLIIGLIVGAMFTGLLTVVLEIEWKKPL